MFISLSRTDFPMWNRRPSSKFRMEHTAPFPTALVYNVSTKVSGYDLGYGHDYVLDSLNAIVNQEQLHLLNANGALEHFKEEKIQPCKYSCKYILCLPIDLVTNFAKFPLQIFNLL
jgi:hypothetical protein